MADPASTSRFPTDPDSIAGRLRAMRLEADLSLKQLGIDTGLGESFQHKASKIENGHRQPKAREIRLWAEVCGKSPGVAQGLVTQLTGALSITYGEVVAEGLAAQQRTYLDLLMGSEVARFYENEVLPGPLQIDPYARAIISYVASHRGRPQEEIDEAVQMRVRSGDLLYAPTRQIDIVVGETALDRRRGSVEDHAAQLDHLAHLIGLHMPHLRLGILPSKLDVTDWLEPFPFTIYDQRLVIDVSHSERRSSEADELAEFNQAMDQLLTRALFGDAALALIAAKQAR